MARASPQQTVKTKQLFSEGGVAKMARDSP